MVNFLFVYQNRISNTNIQDCNTVILFIHFEINLNIHYMIIIQNQKPNVAIFPNFFDH